LRIQQGETDKERGAASDGLGGEEGLEDPRTDGFGNAHAGVGYADLRGGQRVEIVILPLLPVDSPTMRASAVPIAKLTSGMILHPEAADAFRDAGGDEGTGNDPPIAD